MKTLRDEYKSAFYSKEYLPDRKQIWGDSAMIADIIDRYAAGYGVLMVVNWAYVCPGYAVYWRKLKNEMLEHSRKRFSLSSLCSEPVWQGKIMPMLADRAEKVAGTLGHELMLRVAAEISPCQTVLPAELVKITRNNWIVSRYDDGDVTAWELAAATKMVPRQVENIIAGDIFGNNRQLSLW